MNHGTVVAELFEYRDTSLRIVGCELADGWYVVEVYRSGKTTERIVCETLNEARAKANAVLNA